MNTFNMWQLGCTVCRDFWALLGKGEGKGPKAKGFLLLLLDTEALISPGKGVLQHDVLPSQCKLLGLEYVYREGLHHSIQLVKLIVNLFN